MAARHVASFEYTLGVCEGRNLLLMIPNMGVAEMQENMRNMKRLMRSAPPGMKDFYRGERDFWKAKIEEITE